MIDLPLVIVEWDDAHTHAELPISVETVGDTHRPTVIHTIGWVLKEDEVGISLVNEFYDATYRGLTFVPAGMVRSVTRYTLTKPRKKKVVLEGTNE